MAKRSKKVKIVELPGLDDPKAPIDGGVFLQAVSRSLFFSKRTWPSAPIHPRSPPRSKRSTPSDVERGRTADGYPAWRDGVVTQVAAAWLLSCVFVRVLEDRGLLAGSARIAGPGAEDSQRQFFELAPSLTERDYLLVVFRELSRLPGLEGVFSAASNPVWKLAPSAEAARALLALFRRPSAAEPAFRFGQADTRFLGDLYQDLSEAVRKRYALLQTPHFIESFILDRTLERAIERFGLDDTDLIDPTCGSGHFLLGAFERLFEHRLRSQPGLDIREAARLALDKVYGADINPYAVAIARFRLTLAFIDKAGYQTLADVPELPLHVVVADSLLHNKDVKSQTDFKDLEGQSSSEWTTSPIWALENEAAARDVLHRNYAAVVANPPYITVADPARGNKYREIYSSCHRSYSLAVPFTERFFSLGRTHARVGVITSNAFMKREYGQRLVECFLPTINLDLVVDTSGAYVPGHGTPTVMFFGSCEPPQRDHVHTVIGLQGEPSTPEPAEEGHVWTSISKHWDESGFRNAFVYVAPVLRDDLSEFPLNLAGPEASLTKRTIEAACDRTLGDFVESIGRTVSTGEDKLLVVPSGTWKRLGQEHFAQSLVIGEVVRDWCIHASPEVPYPYDAIGGEPLEPTHGFVRALAPWRAILESRKIFGTTMLESARPWYEHLEHCTGKFENPHGICFPLVATHNHFVLEQTQKLFSQGAPVAKLKPAHVEARYRLLGYLNSSVAGFWLKQVLFEKYSANQKHNPDPVRRKYEFTASQVKRLPVPTLEADELESIVRELVSAGTLQAEILRGASVRDAITARDDDLAGVIQKAFARWESVRDRMIFLQEELDWSVYHLIGLWKPDISLAEEHERKVALGDPEFRTPPGSRPFEIDTGHKQGFTSRVGVVADRVLGQEIPSWWKSRAAPESKALRVLEDARYKRVWRLSEQNTHPKKVRAELAESWFSSTLLSELEACFEGAALSLTRLIQLLRNPEVLEATLSTSSYLPDCSLQQLLVAEIDKSSAPFISSLLLKPQSISKLNDWLTMADRRPPPKLRKSDFRHSEHWALRGPWNFPKERFISYPGCESDEDGEPVYGWAGWDHLQRAQALATLYQKRKTEEAWPTERLIPMLAGLYELLPWLKQWHNDKPDPVYGEKMGDFYERFIEGERNAHGLSKDDITSWGPPAKSKRKAKKKPAAEKKSAKAVKSDTADKETNP